MWAKTLSRVLVVCGTRPEAIKLAPLIRKLKDTEGIEVMLCSTGQHRDMLSPVFDLFDICPDFDLDVMTKSQGLVEVTSSILTGMQGVLEQIKPDKVIVHGDTNTTMSASLASFYAGVPILHVEAGLRTGNIHSPWPEEANRKITAVLAERHYAPTESSRDNLIAENVNTDKIVVTGNTVIDALLSISNRLENEKKLVDKIEKYLPPVDFNKKIILVTGHRRENFGAGFEEFFSALDQISKRNDIQIVFPVHLNPKVREPVDRLLKKSPNIFLVEPMSYLPFIYLMKKSYMIITDSGGIQEEAPSLGVPVLVTRDTTERPEAVSAGTVKLVGTKKTDIVNLATRLLDDMGFYQKMSQAINPYGDGKASDRIVRDMML